jgi:hypothetical protein
MQTGQIIAIALSTVLSLLSGAALFVFQRSQLKRENRDADIEKRIKCLEEARSSQITETRLREVLKEELLALELRLINEGQLTPKHSLEKK